ncbi:MAG: hypothetical protein PHH01_04360 [Patescibacteria group bacterium]|nr:hypothetical protein [Patescibacteria group bacterium]
MPEGTKLPEGVENEESSAEDTKKEQPKAEPAFERPKPINWKDILEARRDPSWRQYLSDRGHLVEYSELVAALKDFKRTGGEKTPADLRAFLKERELKTRFKKMGKYHDRFERNRAA